MAPVLYARARLWDADLALAERRGRITVARVAEFVNLIEGPCQSVANRLRRSDWLMRFYRFSARRAVPVGAIVVVSYLVYNSGFMP
jgi:hypothetical protein